MVVNLQATFGSFNKLYRTHFCGHTASHKIFLKKLFCTPRLLHPGELPRPPLCYATGAASPLYGLVNMVLSVLLLAFVGLFVVQWTRWYGDCDRYTVYAYNVMN